MAKGPGRSHRKGISLIELAERFPTEEAAVKWFEDVVWPGERACGKCGSTRTVESSHAKMPYWCSDCRSYFSVRTGTVMERSKVPVRKWVYAIYLDVTGLKGVAAMKLHRDIGVSYKTAWFMQQRIREARDGPSCREGGRADGSRGRQRAVGSGKLSRSSRGAFGSFETRLLQQLVAKVRVVEPSLHVSPTRVRSQSERALTLTRRRCRFQDPTHPQARRTASP